MRCGGDEAWPSGPVWELASVLNFVLCFDVHVSRLSRVLTFWLSVKLKEASTLFFFSFLNRDSLHVLFELLFEWVEFSLVRKTLVIFVEGTFHSFPSFVPCFFLGVLSL